MPTPGKKRGPKPKIDAKAEAEIRAILATGGSLEDAADYLGIDRDTVLNRRRADRKFSAGVDRAAAKGKLRMIKKVGKAAAWQAAAWMLERKYGSEYGRKDQHVVTGNGGGPLQSEVTHTFDLSRLNIDELRAYRALQSKATADLARN